MQWEVPDKFEMELAKGESQNHADDHYPDAAHNYAETRFYNNQVLSFTGDSTLNIRKVELRAKTSSDMQGLTQSESLTNATVSSDYLDVILRPVDGTSPFSILVKSDLICIVFSSISRNTKIVSHSFNFFSYIFRICSCHFRPYFITSLVTIEIETI